MKDEPCLFSPLCGVGFPGQDVLAELFSMSEVGMCLGAGNPGDRNGGMFWIYV